MNTDHGKAVNIVGRCHRKAVCRLPIDGYESRWTQLNPRSGQCHLPSGRGLTRLEHYEFPFELNNVTRAYYERMSKVETGQRAADMKAILKTPPDAAAIARLSARPYRSFDFANDLCRHSAWMRGTPTMHCRSGHKPT